MQQLKFNRAKSITPVPTFQQRSNVDITFNTKIQLAKFYHKAAFSPSISTFVKAVNAGHFVTWPNLNSNIIQKFTPKTTTTSKGHLDQV